MAQATPTTPSPQARHQRQVVAAVEGASAGSRQQLTRVIVNRWRSAVAESRRAESLAAVLQRRRQRALQRQVLQEWGQLLESPLEVALADRWRRQRERRLLVSVLRSWLQETRDARRVVGALNRLCLRVYRDNLRSCFQRWYLLAKQEATVRHSFELCTALRRRRTLGACLSEWRAEARAGSRLRGGADQRPDRGSRRMLAAAWDGWRSQVAEPEHPSELQQHRLGGVVGRRALLWCCLAQWRLETFKVGSGPHAPCIARWPRRLD